MLLLEISFVFPWMVNGTVNTFVLTYELRGNAPYFTLEKKMIRVKKLLVGVGWW